MDALKEIVLKFIGSTCDIKMQQTGVFFLRIRQMLLMNAEQLDHTSQILDSANYAVSFSSQKTSCLSKFPR